MKKLTILFSLLSSVLIQSQVLALPNCPSAASVWNNCFGTHIWTSGEFRRDKYAGEWKDDQQHGLGTYYFLADNEFKGDKYEGYYENGFKKGQGTYTWANGDIYIGNFNDGHMDGQGTYYYSDGGVSEGIWKDDEFQYANVIPTNAHASGSSWACNTGYKKVGSRCNKIYVPKNATLSGTSWKCNYGYTKIGTSCQVVPANATVTSSGWECNTGFTKDGNSCNKVEVSIDYIAELKKIKELLDSGVINEEEFKKMKQKIIDNM